MGSHEARHHDMQGWQRKQRAHFLPMMVSVFFVAQSPPLPFSKGLSRPGLMM